MLEYMGIAGWVLVGNNHSNTGTRVKVELKMSYLSYSSDDQHQGISCHIALVALAASVWLAVIAANYLCGDIETWGNRLAWLFVVMSVIPFTATAVSLPLALIAWALDAIFGKRKE